jgi:hypothetical protein
MTNIHALKHTYGARLKAAVVSKDDRLDLLGHKNGDVTDLYCAKELTRILENTNKLTQKKGKLILWKRGFNLLIDTQLTQAFSNYPITKDLK